MATLSKRRKQILENVDLDQQYSIEEAAKRLKDVSKVKFDETVELAFNLNVDPRKADQMVRGVVDLPHGTGKSVKVLAFVNDAKADDAKAAGADYAGFSELYEKVKEGWVDYDVVISTPDLMREVGKLGKVLGPKGLMPSPKAGTVTPNFAKAIEDVKKGKIEYRVDKHGNIAVGIGKLSFEENKISDNAKAVIDAVMKARPSVVKGDYVKSLHISSSMGPGLSIDSKSAGVR